MILASVVTLALVGGIGAAIPRVTIAPLLAREDWAFRVIAATIGLSIFLQSGAQIVWGKELRTLPYRFDGVVSLARHRIPVQQLSILAIAPLLMGLCTLVLSPRALAGWSARPRRTPRPRLPSAFPPGWCISASSPYLPRWPEPGKPAFADRPLHRLCRSFTVPLRDRAQIARPVIRHRLSECGPEPDEGLED